MDIDLLQVKSLQDSIDLCVETMGSLDFKREKEIKVEDALGYTLAQDILAKEDIPAFRRSTMDGFALCHKSVVGASSSIPTILDFQETIEMGQVPKKSLDANQGSQIFTGGMVPPGADAVVPIEYAEFITDQVIAVYKPVSFLENIIDLGDDAKKGDLFFRRGQRVTPQVIALCADLGYGKIRVFEKLKTRIISTGDEILPPEADIPLGKIRDVNSYSLEALAREAGLEVLEKKHVKDVKEDIERELKAQDVDLVLISGSSSKGKKDFVPRLVAENFHPGLLVHGIAIKPGKPTSFSSDGKKIVLGLPGHAVSCYTVFKVFFQRALEEFYGSPRPLSFPAVLSRNVASSPGRAKVQFVHLETDGQNLLAQPVFAASGNISLFKKANAYFIISENEEGKEKGETLWCTLLK